ncbi:TB2/DP1, HVA22 family-domain-containing protein [Mrakia frigida]|uniref:HVA22/TB2/DP1 family protein n=1 Tax=Mrakia frigida TaxID=29902 RepID=UPI003FCC00D4
MGLLGLFSRSVCNIAAFAYPSYASYKSITTNDFPQIERWLVYWCVVGALTGAEGAVGWIVAWIPFYSEIKLGIMLWMVAPQTEGSTYVYRNYLSPLFTSHERDVDALLGDVRYMASGWISRGITYVWNQARERLNLSSLIPPAPSSTQSVDQSFHPYPSPHLSPNNVAVPPSLHSSNSAPTVTVSQHASSSTSSFPTYPQQHQQSQPSAHSSAYNYAASFVTQYAPIAIAAGQAHLSAAPGRRAVSTPGSTSTFEARQPSPPGTASSSSSAFASGSNNRPLSTGEIRSRRAQLEAELAALASPPHGFGGGANDGGNGSDDGGGGSRSESPWLGQSAYEQIGRDEIDDDASGFAGVGAGGGNAPAGGWFGWGGSPQGYQKVQKRD